MIVIDDLTQADLQQETILTVGAFDGVHRGHQALIRAVVERAKATDRLAAVLTFHPHPVAVLAPDRAPRALTTPGEKIALLDDLGVHLTVLMPFTREVAATPAREFVATIARHLRLRELWVGVDFALGRDREGDVPALRELGREFTFGVQVFAPVLAHNEIVSSSLIRSLLKDGAVGQAAELLGRYPSVSGQVVESTRQEHRYGFPVSGFQIRAERAVPANGVYAAFAVLGESRQPALADIDGEPDPNDGRRMVGIHILDSDQALYGCDLVIELVERLRGDCCCESSDDLVAQLERDSLAARKVLDGEMLRASSLRAFGEPCRYRYLEVEHTADRALWVWGGELSDLFAGAARGMYSLMGDLDGLVATRWKTIELEALDPETLLVDWLNELLYLTEIEGWLFLDYRIELVSAEGDPQAGGESEVVPSAKLVARAGAVRAPVTKAHIKAATFHNLALVQESDGWSTVITFDV